LDADAADVVFAGVAQIAGDMVGPGTDALRALGSFWEKILAELRATSPLLCGAFDAIDQ
jgi:hypothetical protein